MADSALVLIGPEDTINTVTQKVQDAGAGSVELLVTEGAPALQTISNLSKLRQSATSHNIALLLITSDAQTLNAARLCQVEAISVQGTQVSSAPIAPAQDENPYVTRALPVASASQTDEELLRGLDDLVVPTLPPSMQQSAGRETPISQSDDDIFAALDSLEAPYATTNSPLGTRGDDTVSYDDDQAYAADLDAWNDLASDPTAPVTDEAGYGFGDTEPRATPPRRFRPEDMELTDDERQHATTMGRRPTPSRVAVPARERTRSQPAEPDDEEFAVEQPRSRRRTNPLVALLPVIFVLALLAIGAFLFFGSRATVTVTPPQPVTSDQTFDNLVIPLNKAGNTTDAHSAAVQAVDISADTVFTTTGTVSGETSAPHNSAKGTVTVFNSSGTPVDLPQGTDFIATNAQGQDVHFASDAAVTIPPATTADNGAQIVTSRGQAQVNVTARAPGSASNVDANTIKQMALPNQAPVAVTTAAAILAQNGPITGGDEQQVRIVTDADVQQVLAQALTGMYEQGRKALQDQATEAQKGWNLETSTVTPTAEQLGLQGQGQVYDLSVTPPVGSNVDPANPGFTITVHATFKGLATPPDRPLPKQLETALPSQLASEGKLTAGLAPTINSWQWDGSRLTASGVLKPDGTKPALDAQTRTAIIEAIQGKSRADAQTALEDFKRRGVISDYTLPDVDKIPSLNFQLDLRVVQ